MEIPIGAFCVALACGDAQEEAKGTQSQAKRQFNSRKILYRYP